MRYHTHARLFVYGPRYYRFALRVVTYILHAFTHACTAHTYYHLHHARSTFGPVPTFHTPPIYRLRSARCHALRSTTLIYVGYLTRFCVPRFTPRWNVALRSRVHVCSFVVPRVAVVVRLPFYRFYVVTCCVRCSGDLRTLNSHRLPHTISPGVPIPVVVYTLPTTFTTPFTHSGDLRFPFTYTTRYVSLHVTTGVTFYPRWTLRFTILVLVIHWLLRDLRCCLLFRRCCSVHLRFALVPVVLLFGADLSTRRLPPRCYHGYAAIRCWLLYTSHVHSRSHLRFRFTSPFHLYVYTPHTTTH